MTKEEAFQLVVNACASVNANLATHQQIQDALGVVAGELGLTPEAPVDNGHWETAKAE